MKLEEQYSKNDVEWLKELCVSEHIKNMSLKFDGFYSSLVVSKVSGSKRSRIMNGLIAYNDQNHWLLYTKKGSDVIYATGWVHCPLYTLLDSPDFEAISGRKILKSNDRINL